MSISRTLSAQVNAYSKGVKVRVTHHMLTSTTSSDLSVIQKVLRKISFYQKISRSLVYRTEKENFSWLLNRL
jgi:hypothetical protein